MPETTIRGKVDRETGRPATVYTPPEDLVPCPTCTWPHRETTGMVCQTCGTDYGVTAPAADPAALSEAEQALIAQAHRDDLAEAFEFGNAEGGHLYAAVEAILAAHLAALAAPQARP